MNAIAIAIVIGYASGVTTATFLLRMRYHRMRAQELIDLVKEHNDGNTK